MHSGQILDKKQLRAAFERASASYDHAAVLQREISNRMLARLEYIKYKPDVILDAGSGTGYGSQQLGKRYPSSQLIAVDIAWTMLSHARPNTTWWQRLLPLQQQRSDYVCGDIEQLPFKNASVGLIWSNLALQWCNDLDRTFAEMHRILRADGLLMFSTFGPDTLKELRQAFAKIDGYNHVNRFVDMHDIGDLLVNNRFSTPVMDMEYITLTYDDVISVMRDLKAIGAHNVLQGRQQGLMGKNKWQQVIGEYEKLRRDGKLPATFEVVYGHAWKPFDPRSMLTPETRRQLGLPP
ncbi:malonyl-CoA O-methyltransferase [Nitrosomonas oligotropha]|uniref:Malonyl-[acyl-carrier protein] O-methyltransferase n=1 Tax=Nitrosomonas oligotropha TaxID=42354 RepID=A0A2T5HY77_9PROT|nr:malonyl-ACP O-methyltransferase BioC [Nitrosomonas oligotropha]PTQ76541.1 malonyl-CoA O-methyltransferase [Nitrosomonas oligotropha]